MNNRLRLIFHFLVFFFIFCAIFTLLTLIYIPKRDCENSQVAQVEGFYEEPENTIDVLFLGSCNMYSSVSPVLIYEKYGITGYAMCCPDQEMSTSYYYLKEALKRQNIKVVVIESLFLTNTNGKNRERYNRFAVDSLPFSFNKMALAWDISEREAPLMKQYDPSAPDTLTTFAGYLFPLFRYHSRTDLSTDDLELFHDKFNFYKGGFPQYNYTTNDGLYWDKVFNGDVINEVSLKYVPMIKQICDDNSIQMIIIKSPNYARWGYDDEHTKIVRDYANALGVPFIDFHSAENNNFEEWDYGYETGRLNVYGVQKLSEKLGLYLSTTCGLGPTNLSSNDRAVWDACVEKYYQVAEDNNCSITPGQIAQICNRDGAIFIRWNKYEDCSDYQIYRCEGKNGEFDLLTDKADGVFYLDEDVISGQGYSYYVVPNEGIHSGESSKIDYYVYLDMPKNFQVVNEDGVLHLYWGSVKEAHTYSIRRRTAGDFNFERYDTTTKCDYPNYKVNNGVLYYYRIAAKYEEDGNTYYSMTSVARAMPQNDPVIIGVSSSDGGAAIEWNKVEGQSEIQIFRQAENEESFQLIDTIDADSTSYTDNQVQDGIQYFYKIVTLKNAYDFEGISKESNTVGIRVVE